MPMNLFEGGWKNFWKAGLLAGALAVALLWAFSNQAPQGQVSAPPGGGADMPEFTSSAPERWINSEPLKKAALKGNVVLLEIWTSI